MPQTAERSRSTGKQVKPNYKKVICPKTARGRKKTLSNFNGQGVL